MRERRQNSQTLRIIKHGSANWGILELKANSSAFWSPLRRQTQKFTFCWEKCSLKWSNKSFPLSNSKTQFSGYFIFSTSTCFSSDFFKECFNSFNFSPLVLWIFVSIMVTIPACHAGDRGSIPRQRGNFFQQVLFDFVSLDSVVKKIKYISFNHKTHQKLEELDAQCA